MLTRIFKEVEGDELTAVQGANTLVSFTQFPVHEEDELRDLRDFHLLFFLKFV